MLQYRNTPDPETKVSPAVCVFGRPIKDFILVLPGRYEPHPTWKDTLDRREEALRVRHMKAQERWSEHTKRLPPLKVGDLVRIQNQVGHHPTKWDKTGVVIEVRQFDQYVVRVDGSGRVTLRNRKFLRQYMPVNAKRATLLITDDLPKLPAHVPATPDITTMGEESSPAPNPPHITPTSRDDTTPILSEGHDRASPPAFASPPRTPHLPNSGIPRPVRTAPPLLSSPERNTPAEAPPVRAEKKLPLALRRLASHNKEGRVGLGEG